MYGKIHHRVLNQLMQYRAVRHRNNDSTIAYVLLNEFKLNRIEQNYFELNRTPIKHQSK